LIRKFCKDHSFISNFSSSRLGGFTPPFGSKIPEKAGNASQKPREKDVKLKKLITGIRIGRIRL
tara:strand:- start:301 stop:492 length:192 start_codon:yes stop_codon:yes gene_type:complete